MTWRAGSTRVVTRHIGHMAAPGWPAQEAHRARPSGREATRPRGRPCGALRVGSVIEGIETINRGIHSPIYTHHFPFFSPRGTMFPHGLTFCR